MPPGWRAQARQGSFGGVLKWGVAQNGWFTREDPIEMDDLGVPPFMETPIFGDVLDSCAGSASRSGGPDIGAAAWMI